MLFVLTPRISGKLWSVAEQLVRLHAFVNMRHRQPSTYITEGTIPARIICTLDS